MPADNIKRAIQKGTGDLPGVSYEEVAYEGYGPGGVAVYVETMTDNRMRTTPEIRHLFSKHGGSLGLPLSNRNGCSVYHRLPSPMGDASRSTNSNIIHAGAMREAQAARKKLPSITSQTTSRKCQ